MASIFLLWSMCLSHFSLFAASNAISCCVSLLQSYTVPLASLSGMMLFFPLADTGRDTNCRGNRVLLWKLLAWGELDGRSSFFLVKENLFKKKKIITMNNKMAKIHIYQQLNLKTNY